MQRRRFITPTHLGVAILITLAGCSSSGGSGTSDGGLDVGPPGQGSDAGLRNDAGGSDTSANDAGDSGAPLSDSTTGLPDSRPGVPGACAPYDGGTGGGATTLPGAPTGVVASPMPYTALISFTPPATGGAPTLYTVSAIGAGWIHGSGPSSPILVQGGGQPWGASYAFTVTASNAAGMGPPSAPSNTAGNTATASTSSSPLVYSDGVFYWAGDYSYGALGVYYGDTTGGPVNGPYDVMFVSQGGGWQPWAPSANYDLTPYNYMEIDLEPTTPNKRWAIGFEKPGDMPVGTSVTLPSDANGTYGPMPEVCKWASYKIPLKNFGVGATAGVPAIYKFAVRDQDNIGTNVWYANNVMFSAN